MKKIKIMTCTFVIFLSQLVMNCQIKHINKIDSLQLAKDFNYFTHKYKHINKDFKINSNNETYQRIFKKNKFFENKNPDYIDSLQVVLTDEFTSSDYQRIALLRLGYTYKRLSLYVRTDEKKLKKIAKLYQINYPYQLKEKLGFWMG